MSILSVIIPLYNGRTYIKDTILSIEEANKDILFEIIIVDDGSTDDGLSIVQAMSKQYSNIIVLTKKNGGIASAREFGLQNCKSKYVAFCDQDDRLFVGYSTFLDKIEQEQADILMANNYVCLDGKLNKKQFFPEERIYNNSECKDLAKMLFCPEVFTPKNASRRHLMVLPGTIWNCIFKINFIRNNNIHFQSNVHYEDDWLFIGQTVGESNCLIIVPDAFYCWTINPKSESHAQKYISNFFQRRKQHKALLLSITKELGAKDDEQKHFEHILDAQTIIVGGKNAMILPYHDYLKEIKHLEFFSPLEQYKDFKISKLSTLFLFLWSWRFYSFAYFLSKIIRLIKFRK